MYGIPERGRRRGRGRLVRLLRDLPRARALLHSVHRRRRLLLAHPAPGLHDARGGHRGANRSTVLF